MTDLDCIVKVSGENLEFSLPDSSTIETIISIVSALKDHPSEMISIISEDQDLPPEFPLAKLNNQQRKSLQAILSSSTVNDLADVYDKGAQERILQQIRDRSISENFGYAMRHNPEVATQSYVLELECRINNHPIRALIDTGATMSFLSHSAAERCGVGDLVDTRTKDEIRGVGVERLLGTIWALPLKVGSTVWMNPFRVSAATDYDCILGIDWLMKNRVKINVSDKFIVIGGEIIALKMVLGSF